MTEIGTLYLIPNALSSEEEIDQVLPSINKHIVQNLTYFYVENAKTARHFLKKCGVPTPFDNLVFFTVSKKNPVKDPDALLEPLYFGHSAGLVSESGSPAIADPGSKIIYAAHQSGIPVKPLVGPSSIQIALMASGLNGQAFTFHGYLPVSKDQRKKRINKLEKESRESGYTQIFMETPYRNQALFKDLLANCRPETLVCVACDLTAATEEILTLPVSVWRQMAPNFHKRPAIFLMNSHPHFTKKI